MRGRSISTGTTPKIDMNSTFAITEHNNSSQRKRSVLSNGKSENGFVFILICICYTVYLVYLEHSIFSSRIFNLFY